MHRGDELIERLLAGGLSDKKRLVLEKGLWRELGTGYPVERLGRLLHSDEMEAVKTGAFLVQELGVYATPLLDEIDFMLGHPVRNVRFDALDPVLLCATPEHGPLIAKAVELIGDEDKGVRWKALGFLGRASETQLRASLPHLEAPLRPLMEWLLTQDAEPNQGEVVDRLGDPDPITRKFAAAAARRASGTDSSLLQRAVQGMDEEISDYASDEMEMLELEREHQAAREERRQRRSPER